MGATSDAWWYSDELANWVKGYDAFLHACCPRSIDYANALTAAFDADDIVGGILDFSAVRTILADE
jgi:hypothetical protein